jgi:hypothetical protein
MKNITRFITLMLMLTITTAVYADDLVFSIKPNPVVAGKKVRITVISKAPLKLAKFRLKNGKVIMLKKVNESLFKSSLLVPKHYKGDYSGNLVIVLHSGQKLILPTSLTVITPQLGTGGFVGEIPEMTQIKQDKVTDLNMQVNELEDNMDLLQQEKNNLKDNITDLQKEIEKLKNSKRNKNKEEELKKNAALLDQLKSQLNEQQKKIENELNSLKEKMKELNRSQHKLDEKESLLINLEKELRRRENTMLKQQEKSLQQQKASTKKEEMLKKKQEASTKKEKMLKKEQGSITEKSNQIAQKEKDLAKREKKAEVLAGVLNDQIQEQNKLIKSRQDKLNEIKSKMSQEQAQTRKQQKHVVIEKMNIEKMKEEILKEQKNIREKLTGISTQEEQIVRTKQSLMGKEGNLEEKEESLNRLSIKIADQSKSLKDKKEVLERIGVSVEKEKERLNQEKEIIKSQKMSIKKIKSAVKSDQENIKKLSVNLSSQRQELDKKKKLLSGKSKKMKQAFKRKESNLKKMELVLLVSKKSLIKVQQDYEEKEEKIQTKAQQLKEKEKKLEKEEKKFKEAQTFIIKAEQDLTGKYKELQRLSNIVKHQLQKLENYSKQSKKEQLAYLKKLDNRVQTLDSLTRLMEKRATKINQLNKKLKRKNNQLNKQLIKAYAPDYRYSLSPFIGLRKFKDDTFNVGSEFGGDFTMFITPMFSIRAGLSSLSATKRTSNNETTNKESIRYAISSVFDMNPGKPVRLKPHIGITDGFNSDDAFEMKVGLDLDIYIKKDIITRIGIANAKDWLFTIGIDKQFHVSSSKYSKVKKEKIMSNVNIEMILTVPSTRFYFKRPEQQFEDIEGHWAKDKINTVANVGILNGKSRVRFDPNGPVSRLDTAKAMILMLYSDAMVINPQTKMGVTLLSDPGQECFVNITVINQHGNIIRTLLNNKSRFKGNYIIKWDGQDDQSNRVDPGTYEVKVNIYTEELTENKPGDYEVKKILAATQQKKITIQEIDEPKFTRDTLTLNFVDLPKDRNLNNIVNESIRIGVFKRPNHHSFYPNKSVTRLEFILAVSNLLVHMGAQEGAARVDFSAYKDVRNVDAQTRSYLSVYAAELGYGGDGKSRLRPNKLITRAEAATIITRLMEWRYK